MKTSKMIGWGTASLVFSVAMAACSTATESSNISTAPVIAERVQLPDCGEMIVCDFKKATDTLDIPLSMLVEDFQIVKLDNRDEALVGGWVRTTISDNYILVSNYRQTPYKLFDRKGKFICTVGAYGQGPNEYQSTYSEQIDEKNNRIYIMPWMTDKILAFDLEGNPQPPIPLKTFVPKGNFRVDTADSTVIVTTLPFEGLPNVVWVQDMHGVRKQAVSSPWLTVPRDFSNEILDSRNTDAYDVQLMVIMPEARQDSLYHYNIEKNRLEPKFTAHFVGETMPWHQYVELPGYVLCYANYPVQKSENVWVGGSDLKWVIVDKQTLRGNYMRFYDDFLGCGTWPSFSHGYYTLNMEPLALQKQLEEALKQESLSEETKKRITELSASLSEDDNNVVVFAKMKGENK